MDQPPLPSVPPYKYHLALNRDEILAIASKRWLTAEELIHLIAQFRSLGFETLPGPCKAPQPGCLYFYDRTALELEQKNYKADGVAWLSRKGEKRVLETYLGLKIDGIDRISGVYCRSADSSSSFRRRIYRTTDASDANANIVVVHYRNETEKSSSSSTSFSSLAYRKSMDIAAHGGGGNSRGMDTFPTDLVIQQEQQQQLQRQYQSSAHAQAQAQEDAFDDLLISSNIDFGYDGDFAANNADDMFATSDDFQHTYSSSMISKMPSPIRIQQQQQQQYHQLQYQHQHHQHHHYHQQQQQQHNSSSNNNNDVCM